MTVANDSVLVTPGSGATIATHTASSKEHQVVMLADSAGQLVHDAGGVYVSSALAMAKTASKNFLTIYSTSATLIVDVLRVDLIQEVTAAVTGLTRGYRLFRCTAAPTAGTVTTPVKVDTATAALDAAIVVRKDGVTATAVGEALSVASILEDEAGGGPGVVPLWSVADHGCAIPLRQNEGLIVQQDATAGTGVLSVRIVFRVR